MSFAQSSAAPVCGADGSVALFLLTDKLTATMQIAKRICSLAQEQNDPALMIGAYHTLAARSTIWAILQAARKYAMRGIQIWRSGGSAVSGGRRRNAAVGCLCYEALSEWHLGEIASCHATMAEAIALAKELNDMHGLAVALMLSSVVWPTVSVILLKWNAWHRIH